MDISESLRRLYQETFEECMRTVDGVASDPENDPACPLLISPPNGYSESKQKIMYFGQETNGWEGSYQRSKGVEHLLGVYDGFANQGGGYRYGGHFWNAIRHFQYAFKQVDPSTKFTWNNLIKIGKFAAKGRPSPKILDWQEPWFEVIRHELVLLDPDIVIFFSGPNYDDIVERVLGPIDTCSLGEYRRRQLVRINADSLPKNTFRTYHPNYLWRFGFYEVRDFITKSVRR